MSREIVNRLLDYSKESRDAVFKFDVSFTQHHYYSTPRSPNQVAAFRNYRLGMRRRKHTSQRRDLD